MKSNLLEIAKHFEIQGEIIDIQPFGDGHINDTFWVKTAEASHESKYRTSYPSFKIQLMKNIGVFLFLLIKQNRIAKLRIQP